MDSDTARTTRHAVSEQHLDAAIDVVAREMTEVDPPASLRAQVLERIEQGRRRPGLVLPRWTWTGLAATMVLAVATGLWLTRPMPEPRGSKDIVAAQRGGRSDMTVAALSRPPAQPGGEPGATAASPAGRTGSGVYAQRVSATPGTRSTMGTDAGEVADGGALVPALAEIEPLRFSTFEPAALHIPGVEVAPLDARPTIDIPSLNPGSTDIRSADLKKEK